MESHCEYHHAWKTCSETNTSGAASAPCCHRECARNLTGVNYCGPVAPGRPGDARSPAPGPGGGRSAGPRTAGRLFAGKDGRPDRVCRAADASPLSPGLQPSRSGRPGQRPAVPPRELEREILPGLLLLQEHAAGLLESQARIARLWRLGRKPAPGQPVKPSLSEMPQDASATPEVPSPASERREEALHVPGG